MTDEQTSHRITLLTWAVGVSVALSLATMSMVVTLSYQVGQIAGQLGVLISHVQLH